MRGIFIEHLTWPEAEAALREYDTLVVPVGARCKEHGPHLPLNTDFLFAEYLVRRVVERCRVLAAPTIPFGFYPAFVGYPGSVHVRSETFRDTVVDVCRSFVRHGTRKFYVLNTGISTIAALVEVKEIIAKDGARLEFSDPRTWGAEARRQVERQPLGTHADEIETSNMLYVAPQVVHLDRAVPELAPDARGGLTRDPAAPGIHSPTGSWGDPTLATADKGRVVTEAILADIVRCLRDEFDV